MRLYLVIRDIFAVFKTGSYWPKIIQLMEFFFLLFVFKSNNTNDNKSEWNIFIPIDRIFYILVVVGFGHVLYSSLQLGMCMGIYICQLYRWTIVHPNIIFLRAHRPCIRHIYHIDRKQRNVHSILSTVPYKILVELLFVHYFDRILFKIIVIKNRKSIGVVFSLTGCCNKYQLSPFT